MQSEEKQECPECAERIPVGVVACPLCGADLAWRLRPGEAAASLDAIRQGLDDYMGFGAYRKEVATGSSVFTAKTIVGALIAFGCFLVVVAGGASSGSDSEGIVVLGVIGGIICSICTLVCLAHDLGSMRLAKVRDPKTFVKRFIMAALRGRERRAYLATAPSSRAPSTMHEVDLGALPQHAEVPRIDSLGGFRKYWQKYVKAGPCLQTRTVALRKVHPAREVVPGLYAVDVDLRVTSYPSLVVLSFLVIGLFVVLVILVLQKKHDLTVTKLVIEHRGRLFMLEPELIGTLDLALGNPL